MKIFQIKGKSESEWSDESFIHSLTLEIKWWMLVIIGIIILMVII